MTAGSVCSHWSGWVWVATDSSTISRWKLPGG